jgi:hypothetical protein
LSSVLLNESLYDFGPRISASWLTAFACFIHVSGS